MVCSFFVFGQNNTFKAKQYPKIVSEVPDIDILFFKMEVLSF